jgi:LysM repeat protein
MLRTVGSFYMFFLCSLLALAQAQDKYSPEDYILKYRDFAVIEMHRSGVPASITMAQGILESSSGNSRLAREGNNHFGIKCKSDWTGRTIYADDDAPNECFRAYNSAIESYKDHSEFLKSNWRYQTLFDLDRTDYKSWAEGLRKAGYATNPKYANILINLIERYSLHHLDLLPLPEQTQARVQIKNNEIPAVYVEDGENAQSIAERNGLRERHIYKYNDLPEGSSLKAGDIVYLQPKRRRGSAEEHLVQAGENMYDISQMYGIKLKHLYKKNRMENGLEPKPGEVLYLQKKRDKEDVPQTSDSVIRAEESQKEEQKFVNPNQVKSKLPEQEDAKTQIEKIDVPEYHIVQAGDNIYRIAERYHVLEEDLLIWNRINAVELKIGMKIYLNKEAAEKNVQQLNTSGSQPSKSKEDTSVVYHEVKPGETVYRICKMYEISPEQLYELNGLKGPDIYVGQKLRVK